MLKSNIAVGTQIYRMINGTEFESKLEFRVIKLTQHVQESSLPT